MSYFVQLNETNTTLNLEHITSVEWNYVCEELQDTTYTTTVSLSNGGGYYITENDARTLWRALQKYNQLVGSSTTSSRTRSGQSDTEREAQAQSQSPRSGSEAGPATSGGVSGRR